MKTIDSKLIKKFTSLALKKLDGDWVLIGSTVLLALNIDHRSTMDIDMVPTSAIGRDQTLLLMDIAQELEMPIESINQTGAYFLRKIKNWQTRLVLIGESKKVRIYRPNGTLFLQLKISRLSPSDLEDCLQMLLFCQKTKEKIETEFLSKIIKTQIESKIEPEKLSRLKNLKAALAKI